MEFSDRLKELRKEHHLTQADFAKESNISRSIIAMYETGKRKPSFEVLEFIADFFNVTMDYLLGKTDNPYPSHNTMTDDDVAPLIGAIHRKVREKHQNDKDSASFFEDLAAANLFLNSIFTEWARTKKIPPITITDEAEQLLVIRYRTLDKARQEELTKRADELCSLYSMGVDMNKVNSIREYYEQLKKNQKVGDKS